MNDPYEMQIQARLQTVMATVEANHDRYVAAGGDLAQLARDAQATADAGLKPRAVILRLQRLVDREMKKAAPFLACKAGCDHCCHIPLIISEVEAGLIGQAIGRKPKKLPPDHVGAELHELPTHRLAPCPFLKNRRCAIYADRPLACRLHHNLDEDGLLCEPIGRSELPIGKLNMQPVQLSQVAGTMTHPDRYADIREFF